MDNNYSHDGYVVSYPIKVGKRKSIGKNISILQKASEHAHEMIMFGFNAIFTPENERTKEQKEYLRKLEEEMKDKNYDDEDY